MLIDPWTAWTARCAGLGEYRIICFTLSAGALCYFMNYLSYTTILRGTRPEAAGKR
jgi:hypothetical protein